MCVIVGFDLSLSLLWFHVICYVAVQPSVSYRTMNFIITEDGIIEEVPPSPGLLRYAYRRVRDIARKRTLYNIHSAHQPIYFRIVLEL